MKTFAVILASGNGSRFGQNMLKQYAKLSGKMVIEHTIEAFEYNKDITDIILVCNSLHIEFCENFIKTNGYKKIRKVISGGETRQISSYNGVNAIEETEAKVLIHDAARPLISSETISECVKKLDDFDAVGVAGECTDTIIEVDKNNIIKSIPERKKLRRIQTPQGFKLSVIKHAHENAKNNPDIKVTDDCGLVLAAELSDIYIVENKEFNVKITYPIDILIAEKVLQDRF